MGNPARTSRSVGIPTVRLNVMLSLVTGAAVFVVLLAVSWGDAATAATVAGIFSTVNLVLNSFILRQAVDAKNHARSAHVSAKAPRRFVYDQSGRIIGSVSDQEPRGLATFHPSRGGPIFHPTEGGGTRWSDPQEGN